MRGPPSGGVVGRGVKQQLSACLDQFSYDMLVFTTGLDGRGFAYIWPGKYIDIRVERVLTFAPTGKCDLDRPRELTLEHADGIELLATDN